MSYSKTVLACYLEPCTETPSWPPFTVDTNGYPIEQGAPESSSEKWHPTLPAGGGPGRPVPLPDHRYDRGGSTMVYIKTQGDVAP